MTQNNGHYVVQSHHFGTKRKPVCNLLLVTDSNSHSSYTVSNILQITRQILTADGGGGTCL